MSNLPPSLGYRPDTGANPGESLVFAWGLVERVFLVGDGLAAYQLVGGVMAYQGFDG